MASTSMSILASGASSAATRPTEIAVIHQAGSIAMDTATANVSGAATRQLVAIAATRHTASMNCELAYTVLCFNLHTPSLRGRNTGTTCLCPPCGGAAHRASPARFSRSETKHGHKEKGLITMKQLLVFFTLAVAAVTANAKELKSFLEVKFGESIHQDKFIAFDDALKAKGMSPSAINPSVYAAFKGTYIYIPSKPLKNYDEVLVKANANGEVYYVGVLEFFKGEQRIKKIKECAENAKWVIATYGNDAIQITEKTHSKIYSKLKENLMSGVGDSADAAQVFFGFTNTDGGFSQIITTSVSCDRESGGGVVAMAAEDIAFENAPTRKTQINGQSGKMTSNNPQLSRAQALLAKDKAKKQAAEKSRQKGLDSFCGIDFGARFTGDMQRTRDGRYLTAFVRLNAPFKGKEIVKIYASVTTRRIFSVEFPEADDFSQWDLVPTVNKRYGFEPEIWKDFAGRRHYSWNFSNAIICFVQYGTTIQSKFPGEFSATHNGWKKIADDEFEKESGGDGSSVL